MNSITIAEAIKPSVKDDPSIKVKFVIAEVHSNFNYTISHCSAFSAAEAESVVEVTIFLALNVTPAQQKACTKYEVPGAKRQVIEFSASLTTSLGNPLYMRAPDADYVALPEAAEGKQRGPHDSPSADQRRRSANANTSVERSSASEASQAAPAEVEK
ncbi:hypothetical protein AHAS_Ahas05G0060900 [Arachis hypogaea]